VLQKEVLGRIFGYKGEKLPKVDTKLHNEKFYVGALPDINYQGDQIQKAR
jgi:hypothetical protein